jgi:hypothetical protein
MTFAQRVERKTLLVEIASRAWVFHQAQAAVWASARATAKSGWAASQAEKSAREAASSTAISGGKRPPRASSTTRTAKAGSYGRGVGIGGGSFVSGGAGQVAIPSTPKVTPQTWLNRKSEIGGRRFCWLDAVTWADKSAN